MIFQMISMEKILAEQTRFNYQYKEKNNEQSREILKKLSFTDPVYVLKGGGNYIILDGFARVNALKEKNKVEGDKVIPAFVLTSEELTYPVHLSIILKQDLQLQLSFSEKVSAFHLLIQRYNNIPQDAILDDLSLPAGKEYKRVYTALKNASKEWHVFFTGHRVPGRRIKTIIQSADLGDIEPLLSLDFGINRLEQAALMLSESAKRDGVTTKALLEDLLLTICEDHRSENFFQMLYEYRYPLISTYQKKLHLLINKMNVPRPVQFDYDKEAERPGINLIFHINKASDLDESENWLSQHRNQILSFLTERLKP